MSRSLSVRLAARRSWATLLTLLSWLRPPRRLRFTRAGALFTVGTLAVGLSAVNTGNNLLYLLLGAMLGFIAVSGWLSEQVLYRIAVRRRAPRGVTAGQPARITYDVVNHKRRIPSFAVEIREDDLDARAFVAALEPGAAVTTRAEHSFPRRGVYALTRITLATSFPFGFFRKERDLSLPGEVIVWPATDRRVRSARPAGELARRQGALLSGVRGHRGEYRSLRDYQPGDDPRDIHWRSTARRGEPVIREYERDDGRTVWICLDLRAPPDEAAETAVEIAAALAARAYAHGERFALVTPDTVLEPGSGNPQLESVLDALARARYRENAPRLVPPAPAEFCVLVTPIESSQLGFGDSYSPRNAAA